MHADGSPWTLVQTVAPSFDPIGVARAKERLRIGGSDEDDDLAASIAAAVARYEGRTGRVMAASSWELRGGAWPTVVCLPLAPVRDVTAVAYVDEDGAEQSLGAAEWYWHRTAAGAEVRFTDAFTAPRLQRRPQSVIVRFDAGYDDLSASGSGDDPELVPDKRDEMAILFLVGHWHRHREAVADGRAELVPETWSDLADQRRIYR